MAKDPQAEQSHIILDYSCDGIAIRIVAKKTYGTCWCLSGVLTLKSPLYAGPLFFLSPSHCLAII